MPVQVRSYVLVGTDAVPVTVEVDLLQRLPQVVIVGLAASSVRECADRVRSAIVSAGFEFPRARVVVSVAPADLPKIGATGLDLPIAVGILSATGQIAKGGTSKLDGYAYAGELSLDGRVRPIRGLLAMAEAAKKEGLTLVTDDASAGGAASVPGAKVVGLRTLADVANRLVRAEAWGRIEGEKGTRGGLDTADVYGNQDAIDGILQAVQTRRPLLFVGPPGVGKTMLAARIPGLLGPMTDTEALATAKIHDIAGLHDPSTVGRTPIARPFRAPHHTISAAGLIGGASLRPGECSLAHNGVLFLDELPEFPRASIEVLRGPVEDGYVTLARSSGTVRMPADFLLVAATNPCPCGYRGHPSRRCVCTDETIARYLARLDTPLLKNAIRVELGPVSEQEIRSEASRWPTTAALRQRIARGQAGGGKPSLAALLATTKPQGKR